MNSPCQGVAWEGALVVLSELYLVFIWGVVSWALKGIVCFSALVITLICFLIKFNASSLLGGRIFFISIVNIGLVWVYDFQSV